jgi:signal transduction histidine kinase
MHLPHSPESAVRDVRSNSVRVGRLVPSDGIAPRSHPDRHCLLQFLQELRVPLCAVETMLEVVGATELPQPVQLALGAGSNHVDYLIDLVTDFAEQQRLEADTVVPNAETLALPRWLTSCIEAHASTLPDAPRAPQVRYRSFLPSHVVIDGELAARAVYGVIRVASLRAPTASGELRIAYTHEPRRPAASRLQIELVQDGGGFTDLEQGYVFAPFAVRDAAARPLLGLAIAQRLSKLLGGILRITSPGPASCTYLLSLPAPPTDDASWIDPLGGTDRQLGPVRAGPPR